MKQLNLITTIALTSLLILPMAHAADQQMRTTENGIHYTTGGIGREEVLVMRTYAKQFTLNLIFSEGEDGALVTGVNINIYNAQNELVFRLKGAKPMLYVNLPSGTYHLLATNQGEKLRYVLSVKDDAQQKIILNWKVLDVENTAENNF